MKKTMGAEKTLRDLRDERALTMREVGIDPCTLVQLEKGRRVARPSTLRRLAKIYRVEISIVVAAARASRIA
jgi:transcriptional regulator with XRE-family HTH domain